MTVLEYIITSTAVAGRQSITGKGFFHNHGPINHVANNVSVTALN